MRYTKTVHRMHTNESAQLVGSLEYSPKEGIGLTIPCLPSRSGKMSDNSHPQESLIDGIGVVEIKHWQDDPFRSYVRLMSVDSCIVNLPLHNALASTPTL